MAKKAARRAVAKKTRSRSTVEAAAKIGPKNIILILTDQERAIQWFPRGWEAENLQAMTFLRRHGISFTDSVNNTCACTPSRTCLFTGTYPTRNLSNATLSEFYQPTNANARPCNVKVPPITDPYPTPGPYPTDLSFSENQLDATLPNLATVLAEAGYETFYKGKTHLSKGVLGYNNYYYEPDITRYGFLQWDPPDAGQDAQIQNYGGGNADNDARFTKDTLAFLRHRIAHPEKFKKPFCLVYSLVNPHDVLGYPENWKNVLLNGGYRPEDLVGDIGLPPTIREKLRKNHKPTCQENWLRVMGSLHGPQRKAYLNFYGNLMKLVDSEIMRVLDLLRSPKGRKLWESTMIIRTSDHGEMGLTHGGSRQKWFNAYQESIRVPLIWSNPVMFPQPVVSNSMVSLVDLLPTIASFCGVKNLRRFGMQGRSYHSLLRNPDKSIQDYTYFINTDVKAGQNLPQMALPPNNLAMVRDAQFKYVLYSGGQTVTGTTSEEVQEEFYNLATDIDPQTKEPLELENKSAWAIAEGAPWTVTPEEKKKRAELQRLLDAATTNGVLATQKRVIRPLPMKPRARTVHNAWGLSVAVTPKVYQVICYSQHSYEYTLQVERAGEWRDVMSTTKLIPTTLAGNNGPILFQAQPIQKVQPTYRVARKAPGPAGRVTHEDVVWENYKEA